MIAVILCVELSIVFKLKSIKIRESLWIAPSGVNTAPADPAMQGGPRTQGPNQDARKYFLILHCTVV